jgi:hypothetical protein
VFDRFRNFMRGFAIVGLLVAAGWAGVAQQDDAPAASPRDRVGELIAKRDCWTGRAPENTIPGHAIVTLPGTEPAMVKADVGFGIWLDGDPGTLHAFCP